jgi:hypothetical protein
MNMIYRAVLTTAITAVAAPVAMAGLSTAEVSSLCKAQASAEFAPEGVSTRIKFRGTGRKDGNTEVRVQLYPKGMESFKATCTLDRKTGELVSLSREGMPTEAVARAEER